MSSTSSFREDEGHAHELIDLLRQVRNHQREMQHLIDRVEQLVQQMPVAVDVSDCGDAVTWGKFTGRERGVAKLLTQGMSNRIIARRLAISEQTVKNHLNSIFHKLGVADRTQAVIVLMRGAGR